MYAYGCFFFNISFRYVVRAHAISIDQFHLSHFNAMRSTHTLPPNHVAIIINFLCASCRILPRNAKLDFVRFAQRPTSRCMCVHRPTNREMKSMPVYVGNVYRVYRRWATTIQIDISCLCSYICVFRFPLSVECNFSAICSQNKLSIPFSCSDRW